MNRSFPRHASWRRRVALLAGIAVVSLGAAVPAAQGYQQVANINQYINPWTSWSTATKWQTTVDSSSSCSGCYVQVSLWGCTGLLGSGPNALNRSAIHVGGWSVWTHGQNNNPVAHTIGIIVFANNADVAPFC